MRDRTTHLGRRTEPAGICFPHGRLLLSYDAIVNDYIRWYRACVREELARFRRQQDLQSAIRIAAVAVDCDGKRQSHQRRIPRATLKAWRSELSLRAKSLRECEDFDGLLRIAESAAKRIWGIGELTIYDTVLRIAANLKKWPTNVYLHAGTREGAKALGLTGSRAFILPRELPKVFGRLKSYEIENCLCIYKDELEKLCGRTKKSSERPLATPRKIGRTCA